jgi:hypothetical protein
MTTENGRQGAATRGFAALMLLPAGGLVLAGRELGSAPGWLRIWFRTPFLDRFAYPVAVRRGLDVLGPQPAWPPGRHLVLRSLRHLWRRQAVDPHDEAALTGQEPA